MSDAMKNKDVRWVQRLDNYSKALEQLTRFIARGELNEFEEQGLIQSFEYTYELAWNTLKDLFEEQGETNLTGSRDVFRLAFRRGLVENGEAWMDMIKSRGLTVHTYNAKIAESIAITIRQAYYPEFVKLAAQLKNLSKEAR